MEAQDESQVTPEQTRFLSAIDLEKSQLKFFSHHTKISVGSTRYFKSVNLTVHTHKLPMLGKINFHMQTRQLIVNDLHKTMQQVSRKKKG